MSSGSRLHPAEQIAEAEWLRARLLPFGSGVNSVIPAGFPACVRILHPARGAAGDPLSWAEVAARSGRAMEPLSDFESIAGEPLSNGHYDPKLQLAPPECGNLPSHLLRALCTVLAGHTNTPELCWFCLWEGYGWLRPRTAGWTFRRNDGVDESSSGVADPPPEPATPRESSVSEWLRAARVHLPWRDYLLLTGPLEAALELGWSLVPRHFIPQSPNLFWPQDRAWCVASEIDFSCTLVAGPEALAQAIMADPRFESLRLSAEDLMPSIE